MSEYINNVSRRKEQLKSVLEQLHKGRSVEEVKAEFGELVKVASSAEIAEIEQMLINEGTSPQAIQLLCDVHVAVFQEALDKNADPDSAAGHPVFLFRKENGSLSQLLKEMKATLEGYSEDVAEGFEKTWSKQYEILLTFDRHYLRKENLLFPYLERYGFTGPSSVMWGIHDEIRKMLKDLKECVKGLPGRIEDVKKLFEDVAYEMEMLIYKEEKILFPAAIEQLSAADWLMISEQEAEIGYFLEADAGIQPGKMSEPAGDGNGRAEFQQGVNGNEISLQTGTLTQEQVNLMLTHLPVDMTFVDENDEVRYFSQTKDRIFVRQAAIIGRKVHNCHPPQSVDKVEQIVSDFRKGVRDSAEFWIQMQGKFILIRYFALRDEKGTYRGTLEVSQDVTGIRALEGERRLLDEATISLN